MKTLNRILTLAVATCIAALFVKSAFADDIQPPPWRGQIGTTSQMWEFLEPFNLAPPDGPAPGGLPPLLSTHIQVYPFGSWMPLDQQPSGRRGIWPLSGEMWVTVDNYNLPNPVKYMWAQVTWQNMIGLPPTGPILGSFNPTYATPPGLTAVPPVSLGFGWYETTFMWEIRPNPQDEFFILSGNINVDQIVIDSWCIPEPATFALAGLGVLLLAWRRRTVRG